MLDINYVPVANKANQVNTRIEFGAFTQMTEDNSTFLCGTLFKLNNDDTIKSGSIFLAKIDGPTGRKLNFLYSWGSEHPDDYDKCIQLKYDESKEEIMMFIDAYSPSLQEKCSLQEDLLLGFNKCTLIIALKPTG